MAFQCYASNMKLIDLPLMTGLFRMWSMTWERLFSSNGFYVQPEHTSDCATTKQYKTLSGNLSKIIVI